MATDAATLGGIAGWAIDLMEHLGIVGAGIGVALENVFPPIPSEIILLLAGFTASQGDFTFVGALVATTLGSVFGALLLYLLGAVLGRERIRWLADKVPLVKLSDVDRTEAWFARYGTKAVLFGRMVPIFRSIISIPAGIERMPVVRFTLLTAAGSLVWNTVFVIFGYVLGENWRLVEPYVAVFQWVVVGLVLAALAVFVVIRLRERVRERER